MLEACLEKPAADGRRLICSGRRENTSKAQRSSHHRSENGTSAQQARAGRDRRPQWTRLKSPPARRKGG